jgi:uracil-DNA glycosylase family 4
VSKPPARELIELSAALRARVERESRRGRRAVYDPSLRAALLAPPPAPAGSPASPRAEEGKAPPPPAAKPAPARRVPAGQGTSRAAPRGVRGKKLSLLEVEPERVDYAPRMANLAELEREVAACERCGLCGERTQTVFARGRGRTRVMFIGEAPGAEEDRLGEPFVGRAGKLLDQILDAAGFRREVVYIANILKCRPPENRNPLPQEIEACTPHLERQIELVDPKIICALGKFAAQFLTGNPGAPIGRLRGRIHYYQDKIMVLPTYHPAALLRNPGFKRVVWEDMQLLRREYLR